MKGVWLLGHALGVPGMSDGQLRALDDTIENGVDETSPAAHTQGGHNEGDRAGTQIDGGDIREATENPGQPASQRKRKNSRRMPDVLADIRNKMIRVWVTTKECLCA